MATAFQTDSFENDAFQIGGAPAVPTVIVYTTHNIPYTQNYPLDIPYTQSVFTDVPYTQAYFIDVP